MASASPEKFSQHNGEEDRISNLPIELIDIILNHLSVQQIASRISVLSKTWKRISNWLMFVYNPTTIKEKHLPSVDIQRIVFHVQDLSHNPQENVEFYNTMLELSSTSIGNIYLRYTNNKFISINIFSHPRDSSLLIFHRLVHLHIVDVTISHLIFENLYDTAPKLKYMNLTRCWGFNYVKPCEIQSLSLTEIVMDNCNYIHCILVNTPNLSSVSLNNCFSCPLNIDIVLPQLTKLDFDPRKIPELHCSESSKTWALRQLVIRGFDRHLSYRSTKEFKRIIQLLTTSSNTLQELSLIVVQDDCSQQNTRAAVCGDSLEEYRDLKLPQLRKFSVVFLDKVDDLVMLKLVLACSPELEQMEVEFDWCVHEIEQSEIIIAMITEVCKASPNVLVTYSWRL